MPESSPSGPRQKHFPANAVVCLSDRELSMREGNLGLAAGVRHQALGSGYRIAAVPDAQCLTPDARLDAIIWRRESDIKSTSAAATDLRRLDSGRGRCNCAGVWAGFRHFPCSDGDQQECVRFRDGESLHGRAAEERENDVDLRSAAALDLRERVVSAPGMVAVLVFEQTHRPADRHLTMQECTCRIDFQLKQDSLGSTRSRKNRHRQ